MVGQLAVNHECQRNLHHPLQRLSRLHVVALGKEHVLVNTLKEDPEPVSHVLRSLELRQTSADREIASSYDKKA